MISFHQPLSRFYLADSLQFCINGFLTGFAFSIAQTTDQGTVFYRNRFFEQRFNLQLDPAKAPRVVKVFESTKDIPERKYIEDIYGIDLSKKSRVRHRVQAAARRDELPGRHADHSARRVGQGILVRPHAQRQRHPGADIQNYIAWPATFGMFAMPEAGARAIFE